MSLAFLFIATAGGLSAMMSLAWFVQRRTGQSGWIDATWSFAIGAAGLFLSLAPLEGSLSGPRQYLVAFFALVSASRLGLHIVARSFNAERILVITTSPSNGGTIFRVGYSGSCKFRQLAPFCSQLRCFSRPTIPLLFQPRRMLSAPSFSVRRLLARLGRMRRLHDFES